MKTGRIIFLLVLLFIFLLIVLARLVGTSQPKSVLPIFIPTSTPTPLQDRIFTSDSGDGKAVLTQTDKTLPDGTVESIFTVTDNTKNNRLTVFDQTNTPTTVLALPVNAWSPDSKQFFLIEKSASGLRYLVFKADGSLYPNSQKYLDIGAFWNKTKNNYAIRDVTGWASGDLLYVYTSNADGSNGPAFWFVTGSHNFQQLRAGP